MRMLTACPDCGLVVNHHNAAEFNGALVRCFDANWNFDCQRCKAHYADDDFSESQNDKHAHVWSQYQGRSSLKEL